MNKSIFTKGSNRPQMGVLKDVDFTIPKELWDITKAFRRTPSSLATMYNNKVKLGQMDQKITSGTSILKESVQKLESEYMRKIDEHKSGIKYAKEVKDQEFRFKRSAIKKEREDSLNETVQSLKDYENEKRFLFEKEYKQTLETYKNIMNEVERIIEDFDILNIPKDQKPKLNYRKESPEDLMDTVLDIRDMIEEVIDGGMVISKLWGKVKDLDENETKVVGAAAVLSTLLLTPAVVAGAGSAIALTMKKNTETRNIITEFGVELLAIRRVCKKRFDKKKKLNVLNLDEIQEEFQLRYKAIEDQHRLSLHNLQEEERQWEVEYKAMGESNKEELLIQELKDKKEDLLKRHAIQHQSMSDLKREEEKNFVKSREQFEQKNKLPDLTSDFDSKIFQEIKEVKKILQNYIKYKNLNKLSYNLDYSGLDLDEQAKSTYDKMIYSEEYLPLKKMVEGNEKKGLAEDDFKKQFDMLSRKEDILYILDTNNLHLGELVQEPKYESLGHIEQVLAGNWHNGSILFVYANQTEEAILINYIKYLTQQMLSQLHPDAIQINILNPTMDTAFNDIVINTETENKNQQKQPYVDTYIGKDITSIKEAINRQIRERQYGDLIGGGTMVDSIREKRKMASKTPKFYVNILHRTDVRDELVHLNENSNVFGVLNICLIDRKDVIESISDKGVVKIEKGVKDLLSKTSNLVTVSEVTPTNETILNIFHKDTTSYRQIKYTPMTKSTINSRRMFYQERYHKSLANVSSVLVDEYIMQVVGDDLWSKSAEKGLELHFGYVNGDRSRPEPVKLDEEVLAHGFVGGTTGGGKSVTLATVVNVLKALYPPSELDVKYYDFKQVEVALHARPYKWANASALAGSSTAEYFISLLNSMTEEMDLRYAAMKDVGVNKLSNYRKLLRGIKQDLLDKGEYERASKVEIPPRIIVIMDEVQEGFNIDDATTETLKAALKKLSKVARAAGMHLILLSQNPGSAIPADVLALFTMRGSTKASPDVSKAILNNDFAARPENQYVGFFAVNTTPTGDEAANIRYLVPFTPEPLSQLYSKISADMAEKSETESSRDAVVFDDDTIVNYEMIDKRLEDYPIEPYQIVIGDMVKYQETYNPAMIQLEADQSQNISFISSEKTLKVDFFKTIMKSINSTENNAIVLFGKGKEDDYDVENYIKHPFMNKQIYIDATSGKEITEPDILENITNQDLEDGKYLQEIKTRCYFDVVDYGNKPKYGSGEDDTTLTGIMTTIYQGLIERQQQERRETGELKPIYLIVIDPERDKYIIPDRSWHDKEFEALVNEACSSGIFTITITSNLNQSAYRPWNRFVVAKKMGPDAVHEKEFKHVSSSLGRVRNMVDAAESFTFKLPGETGSNKKPWEL